MSLKVASVDAGAVGRTELQALIAESISKHQPLVIQRAFPHGIDQLERVIEAHGDVECPISRIENGEVTGILDQARYVNMQLASAVSAIGMGAPFYVAQVRESKLLRSFELHSLHVPVNYQSPTSPNATGWPVNLPVFAPLSFLSSCRSCNLWLNGPSPVTSTFHFDSYNNFLCIFAGSKTVHLHPPSSHHNCHPWSHSPNAATTNTRSLLMQSSLKLTAELQHGDVCFIPEGWWHEVASSPSTAAMNFWFSSPLSWIIPNYSHASSIAPITTPFTPDPETAFLFPTQLQPSGASAAQPYVMHCIMVQTCANSAQDACNRRQQHHLEHFCSHHPHFKAITSHLPSTSTTPAFILSYFLCLRSAQSLHFLLRVTRGEFAPCAAQSLLSSLPNWAAYALSGWFESYDDLRSCSEETSQLLPLQSDDYFCEVFQSCDDAERVKREMLSSCQRFAEESSKAMFQSMLFPPGNENTNCTKSGDAENAAAKKQRASDCNE